jgi:DHA1 family tetracycline resistance protein-like MFS transporter
LKKLTVKYPQLTPLWTAIFSDIIGFSLLITVYPSLTTKFGITPLMIGVIISINGVFSFLSAPIWGKLSDHYGRKPILLISQFGSFLGFIILAFSPSLIWVIISRIVDGMFGGIFPVSRAMINDVAEPRDMAKQMANVGVAHNVANLFGPALGGILFFYFGLIGPGLAAAVTCIFSYVFMSVRLKETAPIKIHPELFAHSITQSEDPFSNQNSKITQKWYHNAALMRALIIFGFAAMGFNIVVTNFSMFAFLKLDMDSRSMGIFLTIAGMVQILIRFTIFMPSLNKWGEVNLAYVGFILYLIGYLFLGFVLNPVQLLLLLILNSFATSGTRGGLSAFISNLADPKERGKIQGIAVSLDTFAQILGPIIGGAILTYLPLYTFGWPSWLCMAIALILLATAHHMRSILAEKRK